VEKKSHSHQERNKEGKASANARHYPPTSTFYKIQPPSLPIICTTSASASADRLLDTKDRHSPYGDRQASDSLHRQRNDNVRSTSATLHLTVTYKLSTSAPANFQSAYIEDKKAAAAARQPLHQHQYRRSRSDPLTAISWDYFGKNAIRSQRTRFRGSQVSTSIPGSSHCRYISP
jgi:hypothetical protein